MSNNYKPTKWLGGKTIGTAQVMNNIEQGISNAHDRLDSVESELTKTNNSNYITSNQSKVFISKSSYATDFKLLGNTKILNANDEECNAWDSGARLVSVGGDYLNSNGICINLSSDMYENNVLLNYKLKGVKTVKDEIITENDEDYLIQRCGEILINGSEVITGPTQINAKTMRFDVKVDGLLSNTKGNIIATRFSVGNAYDVNVDYECITNYDSNTLCVKIENTRLSIWNVEVFKKWLRANPIRIIYERNVPIKTKIPKINLNTYTGENTLSINTGPVKTECEFSVTNNLSSSLSVVSTSLKSALDVSRDFNNYVNRRTDGVIQNKNICYLNELNSGFYSIKECTGFPYGWGQILLVKHDLISYSIIYFNYEIDMDISGMYINTCQAGKYTGWKKISTTSTYAIETRLQNIEQENADLMYILMDKGVI